MHATWSITEPEGYAFQCFSLTLGAHARRGLQYLSRVCVCVCVCMYVCLSEHAILAVRAVISITKDAIVLSVRFAAILKRRFS